MNNLLDKILKRYYEDNNNKNNTVNNTNNQDNNIKLEIQEIKDLPYVIQKQELQVFKEKAELIELPDNIKDESPTNIKNLLKIIRVKTQEEHDLIKAENEIVKENVAETSENVNTKNIEIKDIIEENNEYITNFEDLVVEILKESLFTNYTEDYVFEVWFSNIKDIINEMKQYELVPTNIKVKKDKIKFLTNALQESSAVMSENYFVFEEYMQELIDDIKFEAGEELANDLIHTINTNMLVPLSLVYIDNINTEEAEILYEALKSNLLNLLTVFTSKYLTQQYIN
ncbi:MAG: hypothetical protein QXW35_04545 [Candidatus Aenigmatarchaeota archaeon]